VDKETQTRITRLRPAYHAYKALAAAIGGATYKGELTCRIDPARRCASRAPPR
jgi:hypothetical protein